MDDSSLSEAIAKRVVSQYRLSRGLLLVAAWWCTCFAASGAGQLGSAIENPATTNKDAAVDLPPLAVASIKQVVANDSDMMSLRFSDDGVSFRGVAIAWIVTQAFSPQPSIGVQDDLVLGLPSWTRSDRYDVEAKVDDEDVPKWKALSSSQRRLALQPLLLTRFGLQFHHETRERPTYSLVVAKNGPKLDKAQRGETYAKANRSPDGTGSSGESTVTPGKIVLRGSSLSVLANLLSSQGLSHEVVDKTGLTDIYNITLRWSPDDIASSDASLPSLFTALQEQLGLKLEYNKNPIDVIVIDHIARPSAN
jgi:bla regulator protein blaR1